ncbi:MAG TPA: amidohydrolase family protein [Patescibacteria group bacterium]|nr:amidohydrolase family protein [Patescibacteria group bacterium]
MRTEPEPKTEGQERAPSKTKIRRIAVEEHWLSQELSGYRGGASWIAKTRAALAPDTMSRMRDLAEIRLEEMDKAGIAMQVVGVSTLQRIEDSSLAIDMAKRSNDLEAELIARHPDRFAAFAAIPTHDPEAAADELERAVKQLGFKGAMVGGRANGEWLDQDKFRVLWERAAALEAPIYIHPADPTAALLEMFEDRPVLMGNTWAWGVETATHALRLIASGLFDVYSKAQIILGHLGESLPFLLGRLDEGHSSVRPEAHGMKKPFSSYIKNNILITTSGWYQPESLVCTIRAIGADRILFATDYPWVDTGLAVKMFEQTPMSDDDRENIRHRNAERWLKLC